VPKSGGASSAARVFPAGRAVLLYAFAAPELAGRRFSVEGRKLHAVRYGRLALLVGFADRQTYAGDQLEQLRGDAEWLRTEARIHERAAERASAHAAVVPARLLSVYGSSDALEQAVRSAYVRWSRSLARLAGKREYVVHAFRGPHAAPDLDSYLLRVSARAARSNRLLVPKAPPPIADAVQAVWKACAASAGAVRPLQRSTTRGALGSVAYLLDEGGEEALRATVAAGAAAAAPLGVTYYLEGPRLPFTFA
jgi:hypothetical protein